MSTQSWIRSKGESIFCSVIIPSIGRAELSRAVNSVLAQCFTAAHFEIIVVNDSGRPLPVADWQQSPQVRVIDTNRRERCVARNAGAAIARGAYLAFLDDDDWLLPGALSQFWELACQAADAVWLYGGIRVVDETGASLAEINTGLSGNCFAQIMGGAWAPIQSSLVLTAAFFAVGGYNPTIIGTEDLDLCRRIALHGDFANTPATIACLQRGQQWNTTTDYRRAARDTLRSRDGALAEPGSLGRIVASVDSSYWFGRIVRVYLSTVRLNVQTKRLFTAISRAIYTAAILVRGAEHLPSRSFWQGMRADHPPDTLHFVMQAYERRFSKTS